LDTSINIVNLSYQNLKKRIKKNEGFSSNPYKDQLGFFTIGFGHLILQSERYLIQKKISKKNLDKIFINDFNKALSDFNFFLKPLSCNTQNSEVLIEMIFQMGIDRVLKFKKLLYYMKRREKNLVCFEMMNSLWYKQTPNRVKNLVRIILKK
jgi:lysozyme